MDRVLCSIKLEYLRSVMILQGSLDDVEALIKRHEDFKSMICAQDERLKAFSELADKLIKDGHYDSKQ